MRAIRIEQHGVREVLVRVADAGINLMDVHTRDISDRYTLDNVEAAHAALKERRQLGKSVMRIG